MRATLLHSIAIAAVLLLSGSRSAAPASKPWPDRLVGTWEGDLGTMRYRETWRRTDSDLYEGGSATLKGGRTVSTERMRLMRFADHWLYLAAPAGQGVTCFTRTSDENDTWIFENQEHDHPKRIGYRLNKDVLGIWIAGEHDQDRRMDFPLKRVDKP